MELWDDEQHPVLSSRQQWAGAAMRMFALRVNIDTKCVLAIAAEHCLIYEMNRYEIVKR